MTSSRHLPILAQNFSAASREPAIRPPTGLFSARAVMEALPVRTGLR
jgi:hypothetical protein